MANTQRTGELVRSYLVQHVAAHPHDQLMHDVEHELLIEALRRTHGNRSRAALLLGMSHPTLHAKLENHGIDPSQLS